MDNFPFITNATCTYEKKMEDSDDLYSDGGHYPHITLDIYTEDKVIYEHGLKGSETKVKTVFYLPISGVTEGDKLNGKLVAAKSEVLLSDKEFVYTEVYL